MIKDSRRVTENFVTGVNEVYNENFKKCTRRKHIRKGENDGYT